MTPWRDRIFAILVGALVAGVGGVGSPRAAEEPPDLRADRRETGARVDDSVHVDFDPKSFTTRIAIRAHGGRVAWEDVLRAISRVRGLDDEALVGALPRGSFALDSSAVRLQLAGYNLLFKPHLEFSTLPANGDRQEPELIVTLDREALTASRRRMQSLVRDRALSRATRRRKYGLKMADDWLEKDPGKPIVVSIHGWNSTNGRASLLAGPREAGFPTGLFDYPNDQAIAESALLLVGELQGLADKYPDRRVALITHSMGGLVARAAVEDPALAPGNVDRLIMLAPPNQGSLLAECGFGGDLWEYLLSPQRRQEAGPVFGAIEDGLAEASLDLRPGSIFLQRLAARDRHPAIRYTIVLGTRGFVTEEERRQIRARMTDLEASSRWVRLLGGRAAEWIDHLDEVIEGRGDGVVAVSRGRLAGVDDVVLLRLGHVEMASDGDTPELQAMRALVMKRLEK